MQVKVVDAHVVIYVESEPKLISFLHSLQDTDPDFMHLFYEVVVHHIVCGFNVLDRADQYVLDCWGFIDVVEGEHRFISVDYEVRLF